MDIRNISSFVAKLGIKIPEVALKEEVIRFLTETKSERIIELPMVVGSITKDKSLRILDVGCRYSILSIQLASLGHKVDGIDINDYHRKHPNFLFRKKDIIKSGYKSGTFDVVISLSTLEHVGLGRYGDQIDADGDEKVVKEVARILKSKGRFIFTIPFGKRCDTAWYRVYDMERIEQLLKKNNLKIKEKKFFKEVNQGSWIPTTVKEASQVDSSEYAKAMAFIDASI